MRAVTAPTPGGPEALRITDLPDPQPGPGDLLIEVEASAVNRADVLQRKGMYPPPPGAPDTLGLELSGTVIGMGADVEGWSYGDAVCAIVAGGGCATMAVVPAVTAMPLPPGVSLAEAAAVPEVFTTAYDALVIQAGLAAGESVLLHGGSSGIGTAGIQLATRLGAEVVVTVGSQEKAQACRDLGAALAIDYRQQPDFAAVLREQRGGVDVVLDIIGGSYLAQNLAVLNPDGRMVVIGLMGGATAELNLGLVLSKRLTVRGSTLRARPVPAKAVLAQRMVEEVWPGFGDGTLAPVIHRTFPLEDIAEAHALMESSAHIGKILLTMR
ncbi:NAD(P)H-quinone oxidoreductase [soil metagenome]